MSKTIGISPKVWLGALGALVSYLLTGALGFELPAEVVAAVVTLVTAAASFLAPPGPVVTVGTEDPDEPVL